MSDCYCNGNKWADKASADKPKYGIASLDGMTLPGEIREEKCYVTYNGKAECISEYRVLCKICTPTTWKPKGEASNPIEIPEGNDVFIGKALIEGRKRYGKVTKENGIRLLHYTKTEDESRQENSTDDFCILCNK